MYCTKCGKNGKKGDRYCEDCGSKLTIQIMPMKVSKKTISIIVSFFLCIFLIFSIYGIGLKMTSPSTIATKYFKAIKNNDIDEIYSFLDREDSDFVSKELLEEKSEDMNIDDYRIIAVDQNEKYAIVSFEYTDNNQEKIAYVKLKKDRKYFGIYDKWEIDSSKIVKNIEIKVLKDSTLTIDNKDVSKYRKTNKEEAYDTYQIPVMVTGEYTVSAQLPNGLTMNKKINISDSSTYILSYLDLDEELKTKLGDSVINSLNTLYSSAISNKEYKKIKSNFKLSLEDIYDSIKNSVLQTNIQTVKFTDPSIKSASLNEKGNLEIYLTVDYSLKVKGEEATYHNGNYIAEFEYVNSSFELKSITNGRLR